MNKNVTYSNPILPGFYPDPSICRVDDDYYLVTSTFAYFPGVPIFHSKDLIHWEQIGNILERESQLPLGKSGVSEGIFAPTLRYHNGTFYMITTHVSNSLGNFIVTAKDPAGPWSDPYPLGSSGIDPSLFFDDDGKCYYCGTQPRREGSRYFGDNEIYIQELDLNTMKLTGESYPAWHGALRHVEWPEGPHIYKKDGYYYLMISEAGTGHHHAISIARSKSLFEPFEGCPYNPIMTHRHLGWNYPIVNVGHPDIVETQNGEWWMVLLASRPYGDGYYRNLGRETFLTPMTWENGWPIINPGKGIVEDYVKAPDLPTFFAKKEACREDFDHIAQNGLPKHFMYLRNPIEENYDFSKNGVLSLRCGKDLLASDGRPSYVCIRQKDSSFAFETALHLEGKENEQAGIALFQSTDYQYQYLAGTNGNATTLQIIKVEKGESTVVCEKTLDARYPDLILRLEADQQSLRFVYSTPEESSFTEVASGLSAHILCTDIAGGFVGNTMGVYATANGSDSDTFASFDYMEYIPCGELNLK